MKLKSVRIIAGQYRSRKVLYSESENLRPTPDRVRENLFNILQSDIPGAAFLDLFAGTGATGLEALSRGADLVIMADKEGENIKNIKQNIEAFKITSAKYSLLHSDCMYTLKMLEGKGLDIIFMDPPFDSGLHTDCIKSAIERKVIDLSGIIVVESSAEKDINIPDNAECYDTRIYGLVKLQFIRPKLADAKMNNE